MPSPKKSKWQLKRERLEQTDLYYRMLRRVENGPLYERIAFLQLKHQST